MKNAKWITAPADMEQAAVIFQKKLSLHGEIKKATLLATAMGIYHAYIDGEKIGDALLTPGWTVYKKRVQYQTYDVTDKVKEGATLALECGQGWAIGRFNGGTHYTDDKISASAILKIEYADGKKEEISTDNAWQTYTSPILFAEIYDGETQDLTAPKRNLGNAVEVAISSKRIPQMGEWVKEYERFAPIRFFLTPKGERVIDFGQNLSGYVEFKIKAKAGDRIVIRHAEVLDSDGNFYTANYRSAKNLITYVCSGDDDTFKPRFSFQGFRYICLDEFPTEEVDLSGIRAVSIHSEMARTSSFTSGNEKINQLYHNMLWSQMNNYIDVPTDCPQRDERLGWTGDAQVFSRTAAINFNVKKFFRKWLADVALDQYADGSVPPFVPLIGMDENMPISAAWGDAACICPYEIYLAYGDKKLLAENYPMMKKWVDYLHTAGPEEYLWLGGEHFGDWLALDAGEDSYIGATSSDLIGSAYYAYSTALLIKAGRALDKDVSEYEALYEKIVARFREYFLPNGLPEKEYPLTRKVAVGHPPRYPKSEGHTQTALVLILFFRLYEEEYREALVDMLVRLIDEAGCMTTGFLGTPYLLHVLSENGRTDVAYRLFFREEAPSWLYSVNHGATTIWEHWNSIKEDGSFWSTGMNSFNHYAYGSVFDWVFGTAVGINPSENAPGYKHILLAPHPDRRLGFVDAAINTVHGKVSVHWYYKEDAVYYDITVPEGTTASLTLPSGYTEELGSGIYHFAEQAE